MTLIGELVRRSELSDRRMDDRVIPEISPDLNSPFLPSLGLRGYWPMSAFNEAGNAFDQSGGVRTLTYNGNPTYNYTGVVPYIDLDGTGDFLSRADEARLDITGTETYVASAVRGLTMGGWFWFDTVGTVVTCMSKWSAAAGNRSYRLNRIAGNNVRFSVSVDGTAIASVDSTDVVVVDSWYFFVGRFDPSTELAIFLNGAKDTNVAAIPASVFNGNADFNIGGASGTALLTGRASCCFLCAAMLSDMIIDSIFQQTRAAYGV